MDISWGVQAYQVNSGTFSSIEPNNMAVLELVLLRSLRGVKHFKPPWLTKQSLSLVPLRGMLANDNAGFGWSCPLTELAMQ